MTDFLFRGKLAELDPDVFELIQLEQERQARKLILIPSESTAPLATREALSSAFQNIYAEGYPDEEMRWMTEEEFSITRRGSLTIAAAATRAITKVWNMPMWSSRWHVDARRRLSSPTDIQRIKSMSMFKRFPADPPTTRYIRA